MVAARSAHIVSPQDLESLHNQVHQLADGALHLQDDQLPDERRVLYVLEQLQKLATDLMEGRVSSESPKEKSATSALLGSVSTRSYPSFVSRASVLNLISEKAEAILRHPNIFITPSILSSYVNLQSLLHQPTSFPEIFDLYAHKPIAEKTPSGVTYHAASPEKLTSAIDPRVADAALQSAMNAHNLQLALSIISTSYSRVAFKKRQLVRQGLIPLTGLTLAPLAAWTLAQQFSSWQSTMSESQATGIAFAGIMTYVAAVSTMGYVTITTANDQMERVTWAQGVPLWERWIREGERAALDRVASRWGFKDPERRGDEEGEEWEYLREFVGVRGMVLDRVELMEGME
ncbi:hypothetical protein K470DRAFT_212390 [Piedraia hortae CBS 480.64]|uniref:Uncharacterized protein n=1 Tax=Piedraia hortae CBS 480.64 TaxID=1314780 RepID=A0A6A7C6N4_9PEZI|nr:hypothetical protein K470DRAFT_212390 [Piedraia hortae CBS 480.64]